MGKARHRVFISAAASDADKVREVVERLKTAGVDAWDFTTQVLPGANVSAEVGRALGRADAVVVFVSPASMRSANVRYEIQFALGREKLENRLVPVMVKRTPANSIPWILRGLRWAKGSADDIVLQVLTVLNTPKSRETRAAAS